MLSLSPSRYRGVLSHGNACTTWLAVHAAEGLLVTLILRMRLRLWANTTNTNNVEENRRGSEGVAGHERADVIVQERAPRRRRRLPPAWQVLGHGGLRDLEAQLQELAVDARSAPHVGIRHSPDELPDLGIDAAAATFGAAAPSPIPPQSRPMPFDHSGRLHDDQRVTPACPAARQQHPEGPVHIVQPRTLDRTFEDAELVT
jgi:hypothetical protein